MVRSSLSSYLRLCVLSVMVLAVACAKKHPAQLAVVVGTDFAVPDELDTARVTVRADDEHGELLYENEGVLRANPPVTFALTARENRGRRVHVVVEGLKEHKVVVRRVAQVSMARERALRLDMHLYEDCATPVAERPGNGDVLVQYEACERDDLTCGEAGNCESVERGSLPEWRGEEPSPLEPHQDDTADAGESHHTGPTDHGGPDAAANDAATNDAAVDAGEPLGPNQIAKLALGATHSCALFGSGRVLCWGSNDAGELGRDKGTGCSGGPDSACAPGSPAGIDDAIDITAGEHFTCAVLRDGTVRCFGLNDLGQSGFTDALPLPATITITKPNGKVLSGVSEVEAGHAFACARARKDVFCWGDNSQMQLAEVGIPSAPYARPIEGLEALSLSAGHEFMCAVTVSGPRCWGANAMRQLASEHSQLGGPERIWDVVVDELAAGAEHTCVRVGGDVYCVGRADNGRLGVGKLPDDLPDCGTPEFAIPCTHTFLRARMDSQALSIALGTDFSCARLDNFERNVACWGWGAVPGNPWGGVSEPSIIPLLHHVRLVAAGAQHACAVADERLWCWGVNSQGQVGVLPVGGGSATPQEIVLPNAD